MLPVHALLEISLILASLAKHIHTHTNDEEIKACVGLGARHVHYRKAGRGAKPSITKQYSVAIKAPCKALEILRSCRLPTTNGKQCGIDSEQIFTIATTELQIWRPTSSTHNSLLE